MFFCPIYSSSGYNTKRSQKRGQFHRNPPPSLTRICSKEAHFCTFTCQELLDRSSPCSPWRTKIEVKFLQPLLITLGILLSRESIVCILKGSLFFFLDLMKKYWPKLHLKYYFWNLHFKNVLLISFSKTEILSLLWKFLVIGREGQK